MTARHARHGLLVALLAAGCATRGAPAPDAPPVHPAPVDAPTDGPAYDARLTGYPYPHPVAMLPLDVQRQRLELAYMDVAPTAAPRGEVVVLLHGKNFSGAYWADTIALLAGQGYRVVVPDQLGFGRSSKPEAFQYSLHALADTTRALLDHLDVERVHVVGHSMGGMLGARFALMFPDRAASLALVNPIGLEDWQEVVPYVPVDAWYAAELARTPQGTRDYMTASYFAGRWDPAYEPLVDILAGWTRGPDHARIAWVSALTYDMIFTQPVVHDLPLLQAPTLLLIGARDRTALGRDRVPPEVAATLGDYPRLAREAAEAIPRARLVLLDDVGHVPQVEAWDAYADALTAFLHDPAAP